MCVMTAVYYLYVEVLLKTIFTSNNNFKTEVLKEYLNYKKSDFL